MNQKIGTIGLGIMGSAMSGNLLKEGFSVIGYDIEPERVKLLVLEKGVAAASCKEVAAKVDVIITSLPSVEALQNVVHGKGGLIGSAKKDLVVIETSTFTLEAKQEAFEALKAEGVGSAGLSA